MVQKRSDFLLKIIRALIKTRNFEQLYSKVIQFTRDEFGLVNCGVLLYDHDRKELYMKSSTGFHEIDVSSIRIPLGVGVTGKCGKLKRTIYVPDVSKEPLYIQKYPPTKSELAIPLLSEGKLIGVFNFEKKEINGFSDNDIEQLKAFCSIVSLTIENVILFEAIRKREMQKQELIEIAKIASETMKRGSIFGKLAKLGGKLVDADKCAIALYDKRTGDVTAQPPGYGVKKEYLQKLRFNIKEKGIGTQVIKTERSIVVNDAESNPKVLKQFVTMFNVSGGKKNKKKKLSYKDPEVSEKFSKLLDIKNLLVSPLKTSKEIIGIFLVVKGKNKERFSKDDVDILIIFSSLAATIIKRFQIFQELAEKKNQLESITEELRIANEELQNISFAKTNLISNISHELRTPLVSIKGYTDLLIEGRFGNLNEKERLSLIAVKRNAERLINTIDNLIDISKLELGIPRKMVKELVNIPSLIDEVCDFISMKAEEKEISIRKRYEEKYLIVEADREKLIRVFSNIVDNAVKFNKRKGRISIRCYKKNSSVVTEIKDTGIGIPEKYHRLIFNRFFQIESSTQRGYRGSGIGLSLCLEIVKFFNGDIHVKSKLNKGSTFIVTLPAK
jgi:signal transduction histidine kinase/putative methionine-R-sulfoxide reductase with GAF domain